MEVMAGPAPADKLAEGEEAINQRWISGHVELQRRVEPCRKLLSRWQWSRIEFLSHGRNRRLAAAEASGYNGHGLEQWRRRRSLWRRRRRMRRLETTAAPMEGPGCSRRFGHCCRRRRRMNKRLGRFRQHYDGIGGSGGSVILSWKEILRASRDVCFRT